MRTKFRKFLPYLTFLFVVLVGYLLYNNLSTIKWDEVGNALSEISPTMAGMAIAISALIYILLASYDYLSFRYLKLREVSYPEVLVRAFVCYAFNLNLGSLVGGLALRYRVYSGWKIELDRIPYIIAFSTFTNWLGYSFILSIMVTLQAEAIQGLIPFSTLWIRLAASAVLLLIVSYFWSCYKQKSFQFREELWQMPSLSFAAVQLVWSSFQWTLQSFIIYLLLDSMGVNVSYYQILFTFMLSSVVAVFTHIPAGLGVLEVIFLRMKLGVPEADLLVALIIYRVAYYLVPLLAAVLTYFVLEVRRRKNK